MNRRKPNCGWRSGAGFSLLEILIAVLVLSIGVLGLAGLQFFGLKEGQTSYQRSQATLLAYEIADRMRASRQQAAAGAFALDPATPAPAASSDCSSVACSASVLAAYDLRDWDQRVRTTLPSGKASISCVGSCGLGLKQTIQVMWDERRNGATGTGCSATTTTDLVCVTISIAP